MREPINLTFPSEFRNYTKNTLFDSTTSINLMSYSFYKNFNLPELKPTKMAINLAN